MIDLFAVYICQHCGEVLEDKVENVENIDTDNDDVWTVKLCSCGRDVKPKLSNGFQCFETVDHERWLWRQGFYDEVLEDEVLEEW